MTIGDYLMPKNYKVLLIIVARQQPRTLLLSIQYFTRLLLKMKVEKKIIHIIGVQRLTLMGQCQKKMPSILLLESR